MKNKTMKNITIRNPKFEESEAINALMKTVLEDTFAKNQLQEFNDLLMEEIEDKRCCLETYFNQRNNANEFFIALAEHQIVGTIEYRMASDLVKQCTENALEGYLEMGTVFVHPEFQGKGVGKQLVHRLFLELDRKNIKEICFDSGYPSAQKIWSQLFGAPEYFLKDFWSEGSHHMIWKVNVKKALALLEQ